MRHVASHVATLSLLILVAACGSKKKDNDPTSEPTATGTVAGGSTSGSTASSTGAGGDPVASLLSSLAPSLTLASPVGQQEAGASLRLADAASADDTDASGDDLDSEDPRRARGAMAAIFDAATDIKGCLIGARRNRHERGAANCYGPSVATKNHPDAADDASDAQKNPDLPSGDLGIIDEYESHSDGDEACVAAKSNQLLGQVRSKVSEGVEGAKRALCFARVLDLEVPDEVGEELDMTEAVNGALADAGVDYLSYDSLVLSLLQEDIYQTEISVTVPRGELWTRLVTDRRSSDGIAGYLWGVFTQTENDMNLQGQPRTPDVFSILFQEDGTTLTYDATKSTAQSSDDQAALASDKAALFEDDKRVRVADSGNPGYDHVIANVDLDTAVGEMLYLWTAGSKQEEQRALHTKTAIDDDGNKTGWGYFGFAKPLAEFRELVEGETAVGSASIDGMICNWAGPNNSHAGVAYAQKQELELDADTGYFAASASHIGFAAQNSCGATDYDASYMFARRQGNTPPADADYAAWPTFDLTAVDADSDDAANLLVPALLSLDF